MTVPNGFSHMGVANTFKVLFDGNRRALGTEEGGCLRVPQPWMWSEFVEAHLKGTGEPVGVYPMVPYTVVSGGDRFDAVVEWRVRWGCVDIDVGDAESFVHAKNLYLVLQTFGVQGWIERSRSKGYHVWVFASEFVPAGTMRSALLAACQIAGAPLAEVNPKQETLKAEQLGNYVRLPYPGYLTKPIAQYGTRRVMSDPQLGPIPLPTFVRTAYEDRVGVGTLEDLAGAYVKPQTPIRRREWKGMPRTDEGIGGYVKWVSELPEGNRNMGLFWAANRVLDQGIEDLEPLVEAGVMAGLPEWEARRTVESAQSSY